MPDIEPFVSPVDGKVVSGRAALREHNKRHNVTNAADFKGEWERRAAERARAFTPESKYDRARRIERIVHAYDSLRNKRR